MPLYCEVTIEYAQNVNTVRGVAKLSWQQWRTSLCSQLHNTEKQSNKDVAEIVTFSKLEKCFYQWLGSYEEAGTKKFVFVKATEHREEFYYIWLPSKYQLTPKNKKLEHQNHALPGPAFQIEAATCSRASCAWLIARNPVGSRVPTGQTVCSYCTDLPVSESGLKWLGGSAQLSVRMGRV